MGTYKRFILAGSVLAVLMGCGSSSSQGEERSMSSQGEGERELKGSISISGAFALYPMVVTWAEEFKKLHPEVKIDISAGGAGKGMTDVLSGMVDVGRSRPEPLYAFREGLFQIGFDVVKVFDAHRNPQHARDHSGTALLFLVELAVGGGGGVYDERFGIAHIRQMADELYVVHDFIGCFLAGFYLKTQDSAKTVLQVFLCQGMIGAVG